jgi:ATP-binding cassette subfamily B protein
MEAIKVFNKDGDSFRRFGDAVRGYRDFTLAWYKVCWPWMAVYNSTLPCLAFFTLPIGALLVLNGVIDLSQLLLVLCMSFSIGSSILRALSFGGKIPQLDYKIAELEKMMNGEAIKQGTHSFEGKNYDIEFKDVKFSYKKGEVSPSLQPASQSSATPSPRGEAPKTPEDSPRVSEGNSIVSDSERTTPSPKGAGPLKIPQE